MGRKKLEAEKREQEIAHKEALDKQCKTLKLEFESSLDIEKELHKRVLATTLAKRKAAHEEAQKALERVHERKMQELRSGFSVEKSGLEGEIEEQQSRIDELTAKLRLLSESEHDLKETRRREA